MGSFSTALSGLNADSVALNTIGNNLANLNTTAFKKQTTNFEDLFYQQIGENGSNDALQVGVGTKVASTTTSYLQGSINPTSDSKDMMLNGDGFFVVQQNGVQSLTRAGAFQLDANGNLTTAEGENVMGYKAANGVISGSSSLGALVLPTGSTESARATQNFSLTANLNASAAVGTSFSTQGVQVFDSLGQTHQATLSFTKTAANTWSYDVTLPPGDFTGVATGNTGTLTFDSSGNLLMPTAAAWPAATAATPGTTIVDSNGNLERVTSINGTGTTGAAAPAWSTTVGASTTDNAGANQVVWTNLGPASSIGNPLTFPGLPNGASNLSFKWNLDDANGNPTISQTTAASAGSASSQDGFTSGVYNGFSVDSSGIITASYSNGQKQTVGQVAVATVANNQGLTVTGNNNFATTAASGQANVGVAGTGSRGTITDSALELSNVDISSEFADLIVAQRAFEANSKTVTTFDTVTQDTLAMIR